MATILSVAMMMKYTFGLVEEADAINNAVEKVLVEGYRTSDIMTEGKTLVTTTEVGDLVAARI